eukprot:CAMPEP_0119315934 /NCGR_PEP_ID=MMETSP1333-20130426/37806_1 /TAXON_ID=418940 /ORGANISM="Scyphosphaera apsteinii, Strain RCC1455" /LENGTH=96 /DNA_ID=CAMNT_0007321439 /DNA_START=38 /DNA_END=332 /DNA_ORIENTATION=+
MPLGRSLSFNRKKRQEGKVDPTTLSSAAPPPPAFGNEDPSIQAPIAAPSTSEPPALLKSQSEGAKPIYKKGGGYQADFIQVRLDGDGLASHFQSRT